MAGKRTAPAEGRKGIDGWTSNGYGLKIERHLSKEAAKKINDEVKKGSGNGRKGK